RQRGVGYFTEEYVPRRVIIAVAGNVTHDRVMELFNAGFHGFDRGAAERTATPPVLKPGVNIVSKTLEQVHVIMGFPGLHHSAPERYALFLLNDIIGGSMSSRLFQEVREREGLVYAIHSGVQAYVDTGTLYVYAATDEKNFSKVLKSTLKVLRELKKTGVTEEELRRAKDHLKGSLMLSLESTSSRMNRLAKHEMHHGTFLSMDAMLSAIDGVRHDEVQALITDLLADDLDAHDGRAAGDDRADRSEREEDRQEEARGDRDTARHVRRGATVPDPDRLRAAQRERLQGSARGAGLAAPRELVAARSV